MVEPSHRALEYAPEKWLPPLPSYDGSPVFGKGTLFSFMYIFLLLLMTLTLFQIGMMAEMARVPPNLDNLLNEGIAFIIDRFKSEIPQCPLGQRPVMIGRRKASYDTLDKVMKRIDLCMNVMSAMRFVIIDVN